MDKIDAVNMAAHKVREAIRAAEQSRLRSSANAAASAAKLLRKSLRTRSNPDTLGPNRTRVYREKFGRAFDAFERAKPVYDQRADLVLYIMIFHKTRIQGQERWRFLAAADTLDDALEFLNQNRGKVLSVTTVAGRRGADVPKQQPPAGPGKFFGEVNRVKKVQVPKLDPRGKPVKRSHPMKKTVAQWKAIAKSTAFDGFRKKILASIKGLADNQDVTIKVKSPVMITKMVPTWIWTGGAWVPGIDADEHPQFPDMTHPEQTRMQAKRARAERESRIARALQTQAARRKRAQTRKKHTEQEDLVSALADAMDAPGAQPVTDMGVDEIANLLFDLARQIRKEVINLRYYIRTLYSIEKRLLVIRYSLAQD